MKRVSNGFTVAEVLLVVVLLGLLTVAVTRNGWFTLDRARESAAFADMSIYQITINEVMDEYGETIDTLSSMVPYMNQKLQSSLYVVDTDDNTIVSINDSISSGEKYKIELVDSDDGDEEYLISTGRLYIRFRLE